MYSGSKLWKTKEQAWKRSKPNSELNSNSEKARGKQNRLANRKQRHNTGFGEQADRQDNRERRFRLSSLYVDGVLVHVVRGQTPSEGSEGFKCGSDRCWPSVLSVIVEAVQVSELKSKGAWQVQDHALA